MFIKVKVTAGAKRELFERTGKDGFRVSVKEPAERNMANAKVRELIAGHFKIPVSGVRIVNGHRESSKMLSVAVEGASGV